jgi:hypothetical protein
LLLRAKEFHQRNQEQKNTSPPDLLLSARECRQRNQEQNAILVICS